MEIGFKYKGKYIENRRRHVVCEGLESCRRDGLVGGEWGLNSGGGMW